MRLILGDRLKASVLTSLIAYMVLLQGLIGAYAQGALAVQKPGSAVIICSSAGATPDRHSPDDDTPLESIVHDCCGALCHAAASHTAILPANNLGTGFDAEVGRLHFHNRHAPHKPGTRLLPEARAPPSLSI